MTMLLQPGDSARSYCVRCENYDSGVQTDNTGMHHESTSPAPGKTIYITESSYISRNH